MIYGLHDIRQKVSDLALQYGAERIFLFGSYARGEATADSDIDLRIDRGHIKGWALGGLLMDLEAALNKKVDLFHYRQFGYNIFKCHYLIKVR